MHSHRTLELLGSSYADDYLSWIDFLKSNIKESERKKDGRLFTTDDDQGSASED